MFKKQITTVVDIWEDWIVFPPDFTSQLRRRLEGAKALEDNVDQGESTVHTANKGFASASRFKSSTFQLAVEPLVSTSAGEGDPMDVSSEEDNKDLGLDFDGDPVNDVNYDRLKDGELIGEDIDGDPIAEDVDGEPITEDVDGEPITEDVDGEPLGDDLDIDGIPVDDDIDGVTPSSWSSFHEMHLGPRDSMSSSRLSIIFQFNKTNKLVQETSQQEEVHWTTGD